MSGRKSWRDAGISCLHRAAAGLTLNETERANRDGQAELRRGADKTVQRRRRDGKSSKRLGSKQHDSRTW